MRTGRLVRGVAVLSMAVVMAGCTKTLDIPKLETTLKTDIAKKAGAPVKSVSCPDKVTAKKGDTFVCTLIAGDGSTHHVKVTQNDDSGHVSYQVTD